MTETGQMPAPRSAAVCVHPREQPPWYLAFIGVDPARQGYGVGAGLLRSRLRRCDEEGVPAYLESSKLENVPLYQHFGFHVTSTLGLPQCTRCHHHVAAGRLER